MKTKGIGVPDSEVVNYPDKYCDHFLDPVETDDLY